MHRLGCKKIAVDCGCRDVAASYLLTKEQTMKKIINGKTFNTETAERIDSFFNYANRDAEEYGETLYLTKNGTYFIHAKGGPYSAAADRSCPGRLSWGQFIKPLSEDEARSWMETHSDTDSYHSRWGLVEA
jgi:hypothetical protein